MINPTMEGLGKKRSVIREIFEYAKKRSAEIGTENVFDFSLGNPSIPAPPSVEKTLKELVEGTDPVLLHGYTSAQGDASVRRAIADSICRRFGAHTNADLIYMTCGAAASLRISFGALACEGDEILTFAPCFPEYKVFAESAGAKFVLIPSASDLQIDFDALEGAITPQTKAVLINSPNNPSGVIYGDEALRRLASVLRKKEAQYGHSVYLIADEPYRELTYGKAVPYPMAYYDDTLVCYSWSKSLSLPGERIGYIAVCERAADAGDLYAAICGAGRALGYVCAPALFQRLVAVCGEETSDIGVYRKNRDSLVQGLRAAGYTCVEPDGAFYLFVKALEADETAFCERAKKYELLLVPGGDFGCPGYVRVAYCVAPEVIEKAMPAFRRLAQEYGGKL